MTKTTYDTADISDKSAVSAEIRPSEYKLYHSKDAPAYSIAAKTLKSFENSAQDETPAEQDKAMRQLAQNLLSNVESFRDDNVRGLMSMLLNQATLLDALFNRTLQQAGIEDKDSYCHAKADIALQAQRQCKHLLDFVTKNF